MCIFFWQCVSVLYLREAGMSGASLLSLWGHAATALLHSGPTGQLLHSPKYIILSASRSQDTLLPPSRSPHSLSPSTRWGNEGGQMCRQRVLVQQRSMDLTEQLFVRSWKPSTAALHLATVMGRPRGTLSQPFYRLWNSLERWMKLRSQPASSLACLKVLRVVNARPQVHLPCQGVHPHSWILDANDTCYTIARDSEVVYAFKCILSGSFKAAAVSNLWTCDEWKG